MTSKKAEEGGECVRIYLEMASKIEREVQFPERKWRRIQSGRGN